MFTDVKSDRKSDRNNQLVSLTDRQTKRPASAHVPSRGDGRGGGRVRRAPGGASSRIARDSKGIGV